MATTDRAGPPVFGDVVQLRIPMFDASGSRTMCRGRRWRWSIDLGDERRLSPVKKILDHRAAVHEAARQVWKRCLADDNQQGDAVLHDGIELIRLVANPAIWRECDPSALAGRPEPQLVRRIVGEVISVPLDCQVAGFQNLRESFAEIAIGEIDKAQAARS